MRLKSNFVKSCRGTLALAIAATFAASNAHAIDYYWDTDDITPGFGTASGNWGTSAFFSTDATGSSTTALATTTNADILNFGTATTGLAAGSIATNAQTINGLTYGSASGAIALTGGIITLSGTTPTITTNTVVGTNHTIANVLTGSVGLTKAGVGRVTLTGLNTYTGNTIVSGGTLALGGAGGTGIIRGNVAVNTGATLLLTGANALGYNTGVKVNQLDLTGGTINTTAAGDNGWAITINLTSGTMQSNGGVGNAAATTYYSMGSSSAINSLASATSSTIAGRLNLREGNPSNQLPFTVADGAVANDLVVSGAITDYPAGTSTGTNGYGISKAGAGNMVLTGQSTFTGTTTVNAGTLTLSSSGAAGTLRSPVIVNTGAILSSTIGDSMGYTVGLQIPTLTLNGGSYNNAVNANQGYTTNVVLVGGTMSGLGQFNFTNGYGITSNAAATTSTISMNVLIRDTNNMPVNVADGAAANDLDITGVVSGYALNKSGAGTLRLTAVNTYTNTTTVTNGVLAIAGANGTIATTSGITVTTGGTLRLDNTAGNNGNRVANGTAIALASGNLELTGATALNYSETVGALNASGSSRVTSVQASVGNTAALTLSSLNRINNGVIDFAGTGLGTDSQNRILITGFAATPFIGTWATYNGTGWAAYDATNGVTELTGYSDIDALGGVIPDSSGTHARINSTGISGNVTLAGGSTNTIATLIQATTTASTVDTTGKTLLTDGILVGTGKAALTIGVSPAAGTLMATTPGGELVLNNLSSNPLTINASLVNNTSASALTTSGSVVLASTGNTYSGTTRAVAGTLQAGGVNTLSPNSSFNLANIAGVTLNLGGFANAIGSLAGGGTTGGNVTLGAATLTTGGDNTNTSYAGVISGSGGFTKTGTGTQTLTGTNAYTGATLVSGGVLSLGGAAGRTTSSFSVGAGATLELNGTNIISDGHGTAVANTRTITVDGGTLLATTNAEMRIGNVALRNGATFTSNRPLTAFDLLLGNTSTGAATISVANTLGNTTPSVMNGSGGLHLQGVQNFDVADVTGTSAADLTVNMILAAQGSIGGTVGGINKLGAGTMVLTNANTYTGATTITNGTLQIGNGGSTGSIATTTSIVNNGTMAINRNDAFSPPVIISGSGTFQQNGTGTTTLAGTNTYAGSTTVNAGSLIVTGSLANNGITNILMAAPSDTLVAGVATLTRPIAAGLNKYAGYGSKVTLASLDPVLNAPLQTTAEILMSGTNAAPNNLTMQWRTRTTAEAAPSNPNAVLSDVIAITDTGSDIFVLQMSYTDAVLTNMGLVEDAIAQSSELRLGWKDLSNNWVSAVKGNDYTGGGMEKFAGVKSWLNYYTFLSDSDDGTDLQNFLGAYGVDKDNNVVWAVVNHNSEFAVIPEPSTMVLGSLFLLGLAGYGLRKRRCR